MMLGAEEKLHGHFGKKAGRKVQPNLFICHWIN